MAYIRVGPLYQTWKETAAHHEQTQKDKEQDHKHEEHGGEEHGRGLKLQRTRAYLEEEHDAAARDMFEEGEKR